VTNVTGFTSGQGVGVSVYAPDGTRIKSSSFFAASSWDLGVLPADGEYLIVFDPTAGRTGSWTTRLSTL
jgi:hypothetical protein